MAVNQKGGGVNTLEGNDDFGLADLGRLEQQYKTEPAVFREMRHRAKQAQLRTAAINQMDELEPGLLDDPDSAFSGRLRKELAQAQKTVRGLQPRMALYKESTRERLNEQAVNIIGREYSERAINSRVAAGSNSLEMQVAGASRSWQSYNSLAEQRENIMGRMGQLRQESMGAAGSYIMGRGVNSGAQGVIKGNMEEMNVLAQQLTPISLAMQQLKSQGLDPQGRQRALISAGDKAAGVLDYNKLEDEMKSGKGMGAFTGAELRKKEAEAAEKLVKALEELRNAAGKTKDELEDLNKNAEGAAKEFDEISQARKIGPPGGGDGYKAGSAWASAVANLANLVGNTIQTMAISQPMAQMGNIGGYANLENQKYDMWRAGNEGNMTERMNMAGWSNAGQFGRQMANRAGWVVGTRIVGGVAAGVAGGLQLADAVTSSAQGTATSKLGLKDATTVQQLAAGGQALGEGISMTLISGKDAVQKISTSQAEIAANLQAMGTTRALTHIPGYQAQQYRNHLMGLRAGAIGLGDKADEFINTAGSSAFLDKMSGVGLGGHEMGALSAFGAANMGSTFNADQAIAAKGYENMGFGSAQENLQRVAGFAQAGSQNPQQSMEAMLSRAVGTGINTSKALNIIAENTGQLVEQSNTRGSSFDTTDAISRAILGAVDRGNANKEFAVKQAGETFKNEEGYKTNASSSFAGMVAISRMQKDLGLDFNSALSLQTTSTGMWSTWRDLAKQGKMGEVEQEMRNQGIDPTTSALFKKDPNAFFNKLSANKVLTQLERGGAGWATAATQDFSRLQKWIGGDADRMKMFTGEAGDAGAPDWVRKEILAINQSIRNADPNANPLAIRRDMAVGMGLRSAGAGKMEDQVGLGLLQEDFSLGERQRNEAAKQGMAALGAGGAGGRTGALAVAATGRTNQALPGANAEAQFSDAAARSAADFGASAIKLDSASGKLVDAAEKLIIFAGASKLNADDVELRRKINELNDKLPKIGDKKTKKVDGTE